MLTLDAVDMVAPEEVVKEYADQIKEITNGLVRCVVSKYKGYIQSYTKESESLASMLQLSMSPKTTCKYDIQNDLGASGFDYSKFELYLNSDYLPDYKYRILFLGYEVGGYPLTVVLEQAISDEIYGKKNSNYEYKISDREELEKLLNLIFNSHRIVEVLQSLINAAQIAKSKQVENPISSVEKAKE